MVEFEREDVVCLYLAAYDDARDQPSVPPAVTATGIGNALELGTTVTSRVALLKNLDKLEQEGVVTAPRRDIEGRDGSRTAYFLTDEGREHADRVRDCLTDESVTVVTNGTTQEVQLSNVDRFLTSETPLVTALARMTEAGEIQVDRHVSEAFVNRSEELATVQEEIEGSLGRYNRTVIVSGAAGMGKSALVREALDRVTDDQDILVASGSSHSGAADPYSALQQAFDALPDDGRLRAQLRETAPPVSPDDPETARAQRTALFDDVADTLRDIVAEQPVVLFLENLQWADEATLALFAHLATSIDELIHPIAFVGTYREPAVVAAEDHPLPDVIDEIRSAGTYTELSLDPLSKTDTQALLSDVVGSQQLPEEFVDIVYDRTGGNPLFVRETAIHLLETGAVSPREGEFPTSTDAVELPSEVTDRTGQRLANLDDESREILRLGAVLGERIPGDVLAAASDLSPADRREYTDVLVASRLWEPTDDKGADSRVRRLDEDGDLQFVSGGIRDAVVDRIPASRMRELHRRAATAYVEVYTTASDQQAARIAYHYEQANEYTAAVEHYRQAGDHARKTYAYEDAIENYERALSLGRDHDVIEGGERATVLAEIAEISHTLGLFDAARERAREGLAATPETTRIACRLLGIQTQSQLKQGEYAVARESAHRRRELATDIDAPAFEADAIRQLGTVARMQSEYDQAREYLEESLERSQRLDAADAEATTLQSLGSVAKIQGNYERAQTYFERSLDVAQDVDDPHLVADNHNSLGNVAWRQGEYDLAREQYEQSLSLYREFGNRHGEANSLNNLALVARKQGNYGQAQEYYEETLDIDRRLGNRRGEAISLYNLSEVQSSQGRYEQAREDGHASLRIARDIGNRRVEAADCNCLGTIAVETGNHERGREYYETALDIAAELDISREKMTSLYGLGRVTRRQGNTEQTQTYLDRALTVAREINDQSKIGRIRLATGRLALTQGEIDRARNCGLAARDRFDELGATHMLGRARCFLGRVASRRGAKEAAREQWTAALDIFESVGTPQDSLTTLELLVEHHQELGDDEGASEWYRRARDVLADAPEATAELHREWVQRAADELGVE